MRLLAYKDDKFSLTDDLVKNLPQYAILSHTWGPDGEEVTFRDLIDGTGENKPGYQKIKFCAEQAKRDGLEYCWVDTCCIDKSDPIELQRSINSMFRWYRNATRCYVYLSGIFAATEKEDQRSEPAWKSAFQAHRWFGRGWTLQELLAPVSVEFFSQDEQRLGDKRSLEQQIQDITGIAIPALHDNDLSQFSVEERFKWADTRHTTQEEDWAYCLLGIFGIFMPLIYGEGREHATRRLKREINISRDGGSERPAESWCLIPYARNDIFIGRGAILNQLRSQLLKSASRRVSLFGLGGVGKTQIALEYSYLLREVCEDLSVFWVHASNTERFRQSYTSIAQECCIPGYDDPKTDVLPLVKQWLEKKDRGRWLMIIDNADDSQIFFPPDESDVDSSTDGDSLVGQYIPDCSHGSILVTTRNKQVGFILTKGRPPIEVNAMDDSEAETLLRTRLEDQSVESDHLLTLASRLEHLPLALAQAAAYIGVNSMTVSQYLEILDRSNQDFISLLSKEFETVGRDSRTPRAITKTWILSFKQIQKQNTLASELLSLISFLDRQAIAMEFFTWYRGQHNHERYGETQIREALGLLKAFSFITQAKDQSVNAHRLVQLVTRKWLARQEKTSRFAGQALLVVSHVFPFGNYENWAICGAYLPHVYSVLNLEGTGSRDELVGKAALLHCVAGFFYYRGQRDISECLLLEAVELRKEMLGLEDLDTLASMGHLALTYRHQGRWEEAEKLDIQVLETRKTKLGADHPDTLTSMSNLASTYRDQGRWEEAEKLFVQVTETFQTKLGADHPYTLTSMANLASTLWNQGRWEEAEKLEVQVIETRKTKLGADHPDTLTSMANLAVTWKGMGRHIDALRLIQTCSESRQRVLGPNHPDT